MPHMTCYHWPSLWLETCASCCVMSMPKTRWLPKESPWNHPANSSTDEVMHFWCISFCPFPAVPRHTWTGPTPEFVHQWCSPVNWKNCFHRSIGCELLVASTSEETHFAYEHAVVIPGGNGTSGKCLNILAPPLAYQTAITITLEHQLYHIFRSASLPSQL